MALRNSIGSGYTSNADGWDMTGGTTARKLTVSGADIVVTGAGTNVHTFPNATDTMMGQTTNLASQTDQETATSTIAYVSPGRQQFHPSAAKFWAQVTGAGSPSLTTNYNVTSIADTGIGRMTITINVDFSSANWCCLATTFTTQNTGDEGIPNIDAIAAGTVEIGNRIVTPAFADPNVGYDVVGFGDQ